MMRKFLQIYATLFLISQRTTIYNQSSFMRMIHLFYSLGLNDDLTQITPIASTLNRVRLSSIRLGSVLITGMMRKFVKHTVPFGSHNKVLDYIQSSGTWSIRNPSIRFSRKSHCSFSRIASHSSITGSEHPEAGPSPIEMAFVAYTRLTVVIPRGRM